MGSEKLCINYLPVKRESGNTIFFRKTKRSDYFKQIIRFKLGTKRGSITSIRQSV